MTDLGLKNMCQNGVNGSQTVCRPSVVNGQQPENKQQSICPLTADDSGAERLTPVNYILTHPTLSSAFMLRAESFPASRPEYRLCSL